MYHFLPNYPIAIKGSSATPFGEIGGGKTPFLLVDHKGGSFGNKKATPPPSIFLFYFFINTLTQNLAAKKSHATGSFDLSWFDSL